MWCYLAGALLQRLISLFSMSLLLLAEVSQLPFLSAQTALILRL